MSLGRGFGSPFGRSRLRSLISVRLPVIAQLGVGPEDALALLRAHAFADGASMAAFANAVVERRLDFSIEDDSRAFPS